MATSQARSLARQLIPLVAVALVAAPLSGCFLRPKKKEGRKSAVSGEIIDRTNIFLDRLGDGESARIQFKTNKAAVCELAYYAKQAGVEPTREKPAVVPCSEPDKPRGEFTERIDKLRSDTLYIVLIKAWAAGDTREHADIVTVEEPSIVHPGQQPGPTDPNTPVGAGDKLKEMWIARLDVPLRVAEVHRSAFAATMDVGQIKEKLTRKLGCQNGVPEKLPAFRDAAPDIGIKNLATRDFAAATATPHPGYANRLQLNYPSLNDGLDKWSLIFSFDNRDYSIAAKPVARILNMEMASAETLTFDEPQLAEAADPLKVDKAKPLKFSWTVSSNLLDLSYVTVQIGRPENDKAIYCVFQADKRTGTVDAQYLEKLEDGKQVVLAELVTNQIWLKYGWLVTIYDWRSGRIEK